MNQLDGGGAAVYALVAIALVLVGAALVAPGLTVEQRAAALTSAGLVLAAIAWRVTRR